jgi:hypothetical protein
MAQKLELLLKSKTAKFQNMQASKQARLLLSLLNGGDGVEICSFFLGFSFEASSWQNKNPQM